MYSVDYEKLSGEIDPAFFKQYLQENGWTCLLYTSPSPRDS